MKKFLCSVISDVDGHASSKRFVTLCAFFCVMVAFLVNVFMQIHLEEFVFDGMMYLTCAGLGFSTIEKFSRDKAHKSILTDYSDEPDSKST
jgi:hypothetical protein